MKKKFIYILATLFLLMASTTFANDGEYPQDDEPVSVSIISEHTSVQPGTPFWVAINVEMDDHWHAYWKNPGDVGMPISVEWDLPDGYEVSPILWPTPKRYETDSIIGYGYEGSAVLLTQITPPMDMGEQVTLDATISWLACSESACLPGSAELSLTLPARSSNPELNFASKPLIEKARQSLPQVEWGEFSALRKQDLIEVVMKTPSSSKVGGKARFFPEEPETFSDQFEATIAPSETDSDTYIVALKEHNESQVSPTHVKGVLVLHDESSGEMIESLALNVPIATDSPDDSQLVSMGEPVKSNAMEGMDLDAMHNESHSPFEGGFIFYLLTAFVGGLILNLMPCVLPVISLKIMSFVNLSGEDKKKTVLHGVSFSTGVLLSFWILAGALLALQAYGHSVGWGFQLQQPVVIAIFTIIIFVLGLSMLGVFEFGTSLSAAAGKAQVKSQKKNKTFLSSFFSGVLATALATPCTGPLLGPALGFAATQPPVMSMLIFTSLGLGMAFPYLLLSAFPNLLKFLPKPGNWMVTFKEVMGIIMMAVVLWLLWVYYYQTLSASVVTLLVSLFIIAVGCWIYGKWATPLKKKRTRVIASLAALFCLAIGGNMAYTASLDSTTTLDDLNPVSLDDYHQTEAWVNFDPQAIDELQQEGVPVFIDFTAKWCLICQANHLVLSVDKVDKRLKELGVVKMKADWTKHDPAITEFLKRYGRNGVPLYLLYSGNPKDKPLVLPQVLTPDIVLDYLDGIKRNVAMETEHK